MARIPFYVALLTQIAVTGPRSLGALVTDSPLVIGVIFSIFVLWRVTQPPRGTWFWMLSVTLDALAASATLSQDVLWPWTGYPGILLLPETAGILVSTVGSGLRLSVAAAVWGGVANGAGLTTLILLDRALNGSLLGNSGYNASYYFTFLGTITLLAVIMAVTTRWLALRAANIALRADRAERGLGTVLADCHDARSVLTSARLNAEMIRRNVAQMGSEASGRLRVGADNVIKNLAEIEFLVLGVKDRALGDLCSAQPPTAVAVSSALGRAVAEIRLQFSGVRVKCDNAEADLFVLVSGGAMALQRILMNLLTNACEGDGEARATVVEVSIHPDPSRDNLTIRVADNGPGIRQDRDRRSSKATGSGVGLTVVRGITEASGGRFFVVPRPEGGTLASVVLPALAASPVEAAVDRPESAKWDELPA
jgi:signal transduction histidine kinase